MNSFTKNAKAPSAQFQAADSGAKSGTPAVEIQRVEINPTQQPLAGVVIGFAADSVIGDTANYPIAVVDCMSSGYGYPTGYLHEMHTTGFVTGFEYRLRTRTGAGTRW